MKNSLFRRLFELLLRLHLFRGEKDRITPAESTLRNLPTGRTARVAALSLPTSQRLRLLELGFTHGTRLRVVRTAPLGEPFQIKLRGYDLMLRSAEAAGVQVAPDAYP